MDPLDGHWHSRGYLPHFHAHGIWQHVVIRLEDALPAHVLAALLPNPPRHPVLGTSWVWQKALDQGHGCCLLRLPACGGLMAETLAFHHGRRCQVAAWVVMPNHAHVLLATQAPWPLGKTIASWKAYSGRRMAPLARLAGSLSPAGGKRIWAREYWDRAMRDEAHFVWTARHIHEDPVLAGWVARPADWPWSSAAWWEAAGTARLEPGGPDPLSSSSGCGRFPWLRRASCPPA